MLEPFAVSDILRFPYAGCSPAQTVAYRDGEAVSNQAFRVRTVAWRCMLSALNGQNFALFIEDTVDFCCALYGAWLAGKTVFLPGDNLPASCTALSTEVDGFLGDFGSQWSPLKPPLTSADYSTPVAGCRKEGDSDSDNGCDLDLPGPGVCLPAGFDGLVVYTSGSSGIAQAIPKRLSQMAAEVATLERLFGERIGQADILATVSHQHIYGLLFKVLWPLATQRPLHARSIVFLEELLPWSQSRPCVLISSPAHLTRFPDSAASQLAQSTPLRAVFSSGGPLSADASAAASVIFGSAPIEIYGSSETGGIAWRSGELRWSAMPGVRWRLDEQDSVLEVASDHLRDKDWLRMADRAVAAPSEATGQSDGNAPATHFILQGRTDRIVKLAEKRVSLDAIERRLQASPLINAARVVLVEAIAKEAHAAQRQSIAAFIVLSESGRAALAAAGKLSLNRQLKTALADTVIPVALPRSWRYLDALPQNAQGKTTQAYLLALLENPRPTMPDIILRRQDVHDVSLELHIPADLLYFDGHFDATPILPGVVQLNWAVTLGRRYFPLPPDFSAVLALKFQQMISPGAIVMMELVFEPSKGILHFRLKSGAGQHASGRILFTGPPAQAPISAAEAAPHV
jgi:3-hydroxymyristoyl/3-hydroxydecanoyl-(acyl carrier protein) dehydratase